MLIVVDENWSHYKFIEPFKIFSASPPIFFLFFIFSHNRYSYLGLVVLRPHHVWVEELFMLAKRHVSLLIAFCVIIFLVHVI